jgi:hypothetical protein
VIQLDDGSVWIWSPVKLTQMLLDELKEKRLDKVLYIVSPNKIHHIFLKEWQDAFPDAMVYAPPGLSKQNVVKEVKFDGVLDKKDMPYSSEMSQVVVKGSFLCKKRPFIIPRVRPL